MRRRTKYKHKFDGFFLNNRWKTKSYLRNSTWTVIGISTKFFSPSEYEWVISFFGLDFRFWFKRTPQKTSNIDNFHSEFLMKHYE